MTGKKHHSGGDGRPLFERDLKIRDEFLGRIRDGLTWHQAARASGILPETARRWRKRAQDGEEPYLTFARSAWKAEAELEQAANKAIITSFYEKPDLALKYLQNRFRSRYHTREEVAANVSHGVTVVEVSSEPARPDIAEQEAERRKHGDEQS